MANSYKARSNTYFDVSIENIFFHKLILQEKRGVLTCFLH